MKTHLTPQQYLEMERARAMERRESKAHKTERFQPVLEGETEEQYIERLSSAYAGSVTNATPPALIEKAKSFIRAMASLAFEKPASEEMQKARIATCIACPHFDFSLSTPPEQIGHCSACGCGKNKFTSIASKAKIKASTCPKNLWDVTPASTS